VGTGAKNYGNHTQYVSFITVYTSNGERAALDAWASGFYAIGPYTSAWTVYISRWVPSGSNVCGRALGLNGVTATACIHISV
jgi:hypothetical protein